MSSVQAFLGYLLECLILWNRLARSYVDLMAPTYWSLSLRTFAALQFRKDRNSLIERHLGLWTSVQWPTQNQMRQRVRPHFIATNDDYPGWVSCFQHRRGPPDMKICCLYPNGLSYYLDSLLMLFEEMTSFFLTIILYKLL